MNEYGQYHFGRLIDVEYYRRVLSFTNELGNVIKFKYDPERIDVDVDELVQDAVAYKGKPILVTMKTSAVDGQLVDDEFFAWDDDPNNVVGSDDEADMRPSPMTAGRISNKKLAARVAKVRRDNTNHNMIPNWQWVDIGNITNVSSLRNAVTIQGSVDRTRYFINKMHSENWEEIRTLADKLEGQPVLLCLAARDRTRTRS